MKAEGILMHRTQNIIALRASQGQKTVIQVSYIKVVNSIISFIILGF
jgi:hypothetical protein